jgi:hypothetical protein
VAWKIKSIQDFYNLIKTNLFSNTQGQLQAEKDPFVKNISQGNAVVQRGCYSAGQDAVDQTFAQTATEESFLTAIAFDKTNNEIRWKEAEFASGTVLIAGDVGLEVPAQTSFIAENGQTYSSIVTKTCSAQTFILTSLERIDNYAIATLENHLLTNSLNLNVIGANETEFNVSAEIEVLSSSQFRYLNEGDDEEATGTISATFNGCRINVVSDEASIDANQTFTDSLSLTSALDSTPDLIGITFDGIYGGIDRETTDSFKSRLIEFLQSPQNKGNRFQHQSWIKQKTDANYAYVYTEEDDIYFYLKVVISKLSEETYTFTNFTNDELTNIKNSFISNNQLLLGINALQTSFSNPSFVSLNISITGLTPNTNDMKDAISKLLTQYISLTPIKKYLSLGLDEFSDAKIKNLVYLARDSTGNTPNFSSLLVSGASGLDANNKKAILGAITYS